MFRTISEIREANRAAGGHFFDPDAMRFFRSRIAPGVIGGRYFISSEQFCPTMFADGPCHPRRYTIRTVDDAGRIDFETPEHGHFATLAEARAAARALARDAS